jgi:alkylation response protein AidB-like acyl-CoA dehydrogenase
VTEEPVTGLLADDDDVRLTVRRWCRALERTDAETQSRAFDVVAWRELTRIGVQSLGTDSGGGGAVEIASVMEELGAVGLVGPLVEGYFGGQLLSAGDSDVIANGGVISVTYDRSVVPWARQADLILFVDEQGCAWRSECVAEQDLDTIGGEPWVRGTLRPLSELGDASGAASIAEIAIAGYVLGAARRLISLSASYALDRVQFGQPIAKFQAVSHPLARSYAHLESARHQLGAAALVVDAAGSGAGAAAAARARLLACRSAEASAEVALQTHGGMGFVDGTLVTHLARRVRHVSLLVPPVPISVARALSVKEED